MKCLPSKQFEAGSERQLGEANISATRRDDLPPQSFDPQELEKLGPTAEAYLASQAKDDMGLKRWFRCEEEK